jgi:hypothetical protein
MRKAAGLMILLIGSGLAGQASAEPVPKAHQFFLDRIEASIAPSRAVRGEVVVLRVHLDMKDRARTYPSQDSEFGQGPWLEPFRLKVLDSAAVIPVGSLREPAARVLEIEGIGTYRVVEGRATWEQPTVVSPEAKPGEHKIAVTVRCRIVTDVM